MALRGMPPVADEATMPCKEAREALTFSILGLFCFGFIFGPVAINKAMQARKMIQADPRLTGSGKATAGLIMGIIALIMWGLALVSNLKTMGRGGYHG